MLHSPSLAQSPHFVNRQLPSSKNSVHLTFSSTHVSITITITLGVGDSVTLLSSEKLKVAEAVVKEVGGSEAKSAEGAVVSLVSLDEGAVGRLVEDAVGAFVGDAVVGESVIHKPHALGQ